MPFPKCPGLCAEPGAGRRAALTRAELHGPLGAGLVLGSGRRAGAEGSRPGLKELSCTTDRASENVSSRCECPYGKVGLGAGQGRFWARGTPGCRTSGPGSGGSAGDRDVASHAHVGLRENGSRTEAERAYKQGSSGSFRDDFAEIEDLT